jgi:hypothetical protein
MDNTIRRLCDMRTIKNVLEERKEELLRIKKEKEKALKNVPEGHLRICKRGEKVQYYHRTAPKDFNGVYIPQKNINMARKLAQKDYDKRVLDSVEKELYAVEKYLMLSPNILAKDIYEGWKDLKKFAQIYYPDTEIISINPVGLKGLFTDVYQ